MKRKSHTLPDILASGMKVVFCGSAAGKVSAEMGHYYSGSGNKFWSVLYESGLVKEPLVRENDSKLISFGYGLTDLAKFVSGTDHEISASEYNREEFIKKINKFKPRIVAFVGKRSAKIFLDRKHIQYGEQLDSRDLECPVWVLPSTSGAARKYWDIRPWRELAYRVRRLIL